MNFPEDVVSNDLAAVAASRPGVNPLTSVSHEPGVRNSDSTVKSAFRTVELLEFLSVAPQPTTLADIHRRLQYPKSSLLVLLRTLVAVGWVHLDEQGGRYSIGLRALMSGSSYLESDLTAQFSSIILRRLSEQLDDNVSLARLDGSDIIYLASRESVHYVRPGSPVGRRLPAHTCALGKVLLAQRTNADVLALLPERDERPSGGATVDRSTLLHELDVIRGRGWATEEGQNAGMATVAVAIPTDAPAHDALSCSIPASSFNSSDAGEIARILQVAADELAGLVIAAGDRSH